MILLGETLIFKEATFLNGVMYDIVQFRREGYRHYKLYDKDNMTIEDILNYVESELKMENPHYIENPYIDSFKSDMEIEETCCFNESPTEDLMEQLTAIESLGNIELTHISGKDYKTYYYPSYMMYEVNNMAVKIPRQVAYSTGEIEWSYEYLIYPNFSVNQELLNELRSITRKELPLNIEGTAPNIEGRGFDRLFSCYLFSYLNYQYIQQCGLSKGITNAIRVMQHDKVSQDTLYELYQNFRQNKKDTISYTGYTFSGPIGELKLSDYMDKIGMSKVDLASLAQDSVKRDEFIKAHRFDPNYEPVLNYMENLNVSPFEAMENYREMEGNRCYLRKLLYQLNMCWYDDFTNLINYINMVQPASNLDPEMAQLDKYIFWLQGTTSWGVNKVSHTAKRRNK